MIIVFQRTYSRLLKVILDLAARKTVSDPLKSANGYDFYKTVFQQAMRPCTANWYQSCLRIYKGIASGFPK